MTYLKINPDGKIKQWPYNEDDLRNQHRNTSFPIQAIKVESIRDSFGIKKVKSVKKPSFIESRSSTIAS